MFNFSYEQVIAVDQDYPETQVIPMNKEEPTLNTQTDSLKYCFTQNKIGVGGYDVIHYFFEKKSSKKGSSTHQYSNQGVIYNLTSRKHKDIFIKDVEKYLPAFGGWCSMTLAMGSASTLTYDNFKIINGNNLYLKRHFPLMGNIVDPEFRRKQTNGN